MCGNTFTFAQIEIRNFKCSRYEIVTSFRDAYWFRNSETWR